MKSTNVPTHGDTAPTRCGWCLKPAWGDACRDCRGIEANLRVPVTSRHALTGGHWMNRGGIQIWIGPRPLDDEQVAQRQRQAARCGTDSGYRKHYRLGETACDECRAAHSAANRRGDAA